MALVVEDGTGLATAEAYVSVADADAYHAKFANASWAAAVEGAKEVALRKAARYIDARYTFRGEPVKASQALSWPRAGYASREVLDELWPVSRLHRACCELALVALTTELFTNETTRAITEQTVGPITQKFSEPRFGGQTRYALVDDLLAPLTAGSGRMAVRLERA